MTWSIAEKIELVSLIWLFGFDWHRSRILSASRRVLAW
jgi:hypothetical protein